jgi:hypothetical protein
MDLVGLYVSLGASSDTTIKTLVTGNHLLSSPVHYFVRAKTLIKPEKVGVSLTARARKEDGREIC